MSKLLLISYDIELKDLFYRLFQVLIKQMVMGLHALHQHDPIIIHGNLKPSNVLIDSKGCLRLAEFGLHEVKLIVIQ